MARTGRPSRITEYYDTVELRDGARRDRTVADAVADLIRLGNYMETAALHVGIGVSTVKVWMREGRLALDRIEAGARRRDLSARQRHCADFRAAVDLALADAEQRDVRTLAALARGGLPLTSTVERYETDDAGQLQLAERTITTRESLPDARVLLWRLERRFPDRWGRRPDAVDDDAGVDDEYGADPVAEAEAELEDVRRRQVDGMRALTEAGLDDIVDAEIVDEHPPEDG